MRLLLVTKKFTTSVIQTSFYYQQTFWNTNSGRKIHRYIKLIKTNRKGHMETTIWILKGVITLVFTFTGVNKIFLPKAKLLDKGMNGLIDLDEKQSPSFFFISFNLTVMRILYSLYSCR
jgi:hypothetical protein